jgi:DNA-directed RNA polymerase subunit RPC12/RpoP
MTNEIYINGYPLPILQKCDFYDNGLCRCKHDTSGQTSKTRVHHSCCKDNPDCYFKYYLKLSKENETIKNGFGQACESCSSRVELKEIRDIHNRLVALKEDQMVINYSDLQMHGIAFVTIDQMKNYFETAYDARMEELKNLRNKVASYEGQTHYYCECGGTIKKENQVKIAKEFLEEVINEIETKFKGGENG